MALRSETAAGSVRREHRQENPLEELRRKRGIHRRWLLVIPTPCQERPCKAPYTQKEEWNRERSFFFSCLSLPCGKRGIRTPGASQLAGFQDRCNRPLYHLSFRQNKLRFTDSLTRIRRYVCSSSSKKSLQTVVLRNFFDTLIPLNRLAARVGRC